MRFLLFGHTHENEKSKCILDLIGQMKQSGLPFLIERNLLNFVNQHLGANIPSTYGIDQFHKDDIALSVGGDGTFMRTAKLLMSIGTPILGVNTGRMGFLTDVELSTFRQAIDELTKGKYHIETRIALDLLVNGKSDTALPCAMNEVAVQKMDSSSMITINAYVNGQFLNRYQGDGLIVATPAGSTAYSLSVGGPIMMPQSQSIVITPIAPHSLSIRPIVISDEWDVRLEVSSRNKQFLVSADGASTNCQENDIVGVRKAQLHVNVVKLNSHALFENLRSKLMLGADNRA